MAQIILHFPEFKSELSIPKMFSIQELGQKAIYPYGKKKGPRHLTDTLLKHCRDAIKT